MHLLRKSIFELSAISTSHGVGEKLVLASNDETDSPITQIAVTRMCRGEMAESHVHPTMEEFFLFRKGQAALTVEGETLLCKEGDFIGIPAGSVHSLKAVTDMEVMTIGCATDGKGSK